MKCKDNTLLSIEIHFFLKLFIIEGGCEYLSFYLKLRPALPI